MRTLIHLLYLSYASSFTITDLPSRLKSSQGQVVKKAIRSKCDDCDHESNTKKSNNGDRRGFLRSLSSIATLASLPELMTSPAIADETQINPLTDVYFGVGCFWHIQHEFIEAERKLLGRSDEQLTSRAGYAGGTKTKDGKVRIINIYRYIPGNDP